MGKFAERKKRIYDNLKRQIDYCRIGVWRDPSDSLKVRAIKIINLSVRTFLDTDLQSRAAALTYRTLLAIVPAFALLFAIGRGFNLQDLIQSQLYKFFPSQHQAVSTAISFVDSYLRQASQGIFVGVGIVFLLWTLISLLSYVEETFNDLWGVKQGRSLYRKITDYTAIFLLVPILMVCAAGINIFMSTMFEVLFGGMGNSLLQVILDCAPLIMVCVAFTLSFMLIPNTAVRIKYAAISGLISGIAFQVLQMMLISGQIYVTKYNAIYGSFAFLPLLLIWLQISWLILLFGCTLTFSMQNIFHHTFTENQKDIAPLYMRKLTVATAAIVASRFAAGEKPLTLSQISAGYGLPFRLLGDIVERLHKAGIVYYVLLAKERKGIAPAVDLSTFTVGKLLEITDLQGSRDFVPEFDRRYAAVEKIVNGLAAEEYTAASDILLTSIIVADAAEPVKSL